MKHRAPDSIQVKRVIEVEFAKGEGVDRDPVRKSKRYYDMNGQLLAEHDEYEERDYEGLKRHVKEVETENYELQKENRRRENEKEALVNKVNHLEEQLKKRHC